MSSSGANTTHLQSPSFGSVRLHEGDLSRSKVSQNHTFGKEQWVDGLKSKSYNGFYATKSSDESQENRKIRIGDLASIGKSRKSIEVNKAKQASKLSSQQISETVHTKVEKQHLKSTKDLQASGFQTGSAFGRYWNSKYNCDPINDPKYEKRLFYEADKSGEIRVVGNNLRPNSSTETDSTYVKLQEPIIPSSQNIVPQATNAESNRRKSSIFFKNRQLVESEADNYVISQTATFKKTVEIKRRHLLDRNKAIQSDFRPRSKSDPPNRKQKANPSANNKNMISKSTQVKRLLKQSSADVTSNWSATEIVPKAVSVPMKVTSFTAEGHEITQEYIFIDSSQLQNVVDDKHPTTEDIFREYENPKSSLQFNSSDAKNDNLVQSQMETKKLGNASSASLQNTIASEKSSHARPPYKSYPEKVVDSSRLRRKKLNCTDAFHSPPHFPKQRSSSSAPTSPSFSDKHKLKTLTDSKWRRSTSVGNIPESVPDTTVARSVNVGEVSHDNNTYSSPPADCSSSPTESDKADGANDQKTANVRFGESKNLRKLHGSTGDRFIRTRSDNFDRFNKQRFEDIEDKDRRRSETIINTFREKERYQPGGFYESLDKSKLQHLPSVNKSVINEPQRPSARRPAVVASLPDSDLSVLSDTIANLQRNQPVPSSFKRSKWNFPKLSFMNKDRSREQKLEEVLETWNSHKVDKTLDAILQEFLSCKGDCRVLHRLSAGSFVVEVENGDTRERKRHNAVWELFTSERTYLIDHLLVLRQVFMEPLQDLQCEGFLLSVDVRCLFGNLEELCKVSMDFCHALLKVVGDKRPSQFGSADAIDTAFETFGSIMCPPYQRYFSGYRNSLSDRENLKSNEDYLLFLEWCERNSRCQRLKLSDLLITPMQRLTKFPLLLRNIAKYTDDKKQTESIEGTLLLVEESLTALEGRVSWLTHYQFLQDLQGSISWPPVYELDNKTTLPESLRHALCVQPCTNLIANPKRQLVLDGALAVVENGKPTDAYAFLFDDLLLLTKPKKGKRKSSEIPSGLKQHALLKDGTLLTVYRQPIALDRFMVYDVKSDQASSMGLKKAFVLVQQNRFQQMCSVVMLQANTEDAKRSWLTNLASTAAQWMEKNVYSNLSIHAANTSLHKSPSSNYMDNHKESDLEQETQPHFNRDLDRPSPAHESRNNEVNEMESKVGDASVCDTTVENNESRHNKLL